MKRVVFTISLLLATCTAPAQQARFEGSIDVGRILTEVRVVTDTGSPILGLETGDFQVTVGGKPARVEAAEWMPGPSSWASDPDAATAAAPAQAEQAPRVAPSGRTIVLLVQYDFERSRLVGLVRMSGYAQKLVRDLAPEDRVALFVFGTHLQLHSDLTTDLDAIGRGLGVQALLEEQQDLERRSTPSLVEIYDVEAAQAAADLQQGLEVVAATLEPLPGPKTLVLIGWGFGRLGADGVSLSGAYDRACKSFARGRTTVYSLDLTNAGSHSLQAGLQAVAEDTGGFYAKTHLFPGLAVRKLTRVISGYYELSLIRPADLDGYNEVEVRVADRKATVLVRPLVFLGDGGGHTP